MKRRTTAAAGAAMAAVLTLAACSGGSGGGGEADGPVTLTLSGWSLDTTPEFQALADGFTAENPDVTIDLVEYDPTEYNTLVTTDLAAGSGPDIITQKEVKYVTTFQEGGQLLDVSDVEVPDGISGTDSYDIDGAAYAVPYRQDSWVLFYNRTLLEQAGVAEPDGSWTWDDYAEAAAAVADATDSYGAYLHTWQSTVQGFATAQEGGDLLSGDYGYFEQYYDDVLAMQDAGSEVDFNTQTANQLTYQGEFGTQNAAMMPMGTWYVATLIAQQASGEAEDFDWGIAPIPQWDESTTGTDNTPVTFGDPTGFGVNANIPENEQQAAKDFLAYAASADGAEILANIGISPALIDDTVVESYFAVEGAPADELSRFAFAEHDTVAENPTDSRTAAIQNVLLDMHTAIMSRSEDVGSAIGDAEERVANEIGLG